MAGGRNISATLRIGAQLSSTVGASFSALRGKLDGLSSAVARIKSSQKDLANYGKSVARATALQTKLKDARASGNNSAANSVLKSLASETLALTKLKERLRSAGVDTARLAQEQTRLASALKGAETRLASFGRLNGAIQRLSGSFGNLWGKVQGIKGMAAGAGLGLGATGYLFKTQFIDTAAAFETYRAQLAAFGDDSEKALAWSTQFAARTPLNLDEVTQAYVRMRQQGLDPTDGTLQALTDSVFKVGGKFYDLEEIINQLGQAWRKQKLTAEDVKPLINRGIPVYEMLAKAMGKTTKQIVDMQSKGELGQRAIRGMLFELGKWGKGTSENAAKRWVGILGRIGDYWVTFKKDVMESGPFEALKKELETFLAKLEVMSKDGTLKKWAEKTGAALVRFIKFVKRAAVEIWKKTEAVKDAVGGWKKLAGIIGLIYFTPLIAAVVSLTAAMVNLAVASWAAIGPWGLLAVAVIAIGAAVIYFRKEIRKWIDEQPTWLAALAVLGLGLGAIPVYWDKISESVRGFRQAITESVVWAITKVIELAVAMERLTGASAGLKIGSVGGGIGTRLTGSSPVAGGGIKELLTPQSSAPAGAGGSKTTVDQTFNININAPNTNGSGIAELLRSNLKTTPLGDGNGILSPK